MKTIKIEANIVIYVYNELTEDEKRVIDAAREATKRAYAPYSGFRVGVAARLSDGTIVSGNNQENGAYPSGLCAERVVLFYAGANYPEQSVEILAIVGWQKKDGFTRSFVPPCGACRQVLSEVEMRQSSQVRLLLVGEEEIAVVDSARHLLPLSFSLSPND